jgi:TolB-like protein/lipoprotein NlpI
MQVLEYLARRPGEVVTRGELETVVWGERVVGYEALGRSVAQLRKALGDDPRQPRFIETLSKKGYRLVAPVRRADADATDIPASGVGHWAGMNAGVTKRPKKILMISLLITALAAAGGIWWSLPGGDRERTVKETPRPPSIAVLPFANLSSDPQQSYVADGITDNLITDLTQISGLFVIARHTAFNYRDTAVDPRQLAGELQVGYLLRGSVQREADRLRINAQLTDVTTGKQLWAERFDGSIGDIFGLQDRITRNIVSTLAVNLTAGERRQLARRDTENLEAYEYFLRGRERYYRFSRGDNQAARRFYEKAIALDPAFARAYAMLALTYRQEVVNGWSDDHDSSLERAMTLAGKAMSLNEELPEAYFVKGLVHRERKEFADAIMAAQRSIEIDPNYADGHIVLGSVLYLAGQPEQGLKRVEKAMRLNPHYPHNYQLCQGQALYVMGSYDAAIDAFVQGLERYPESERLHVWLAAAYAQTGQADAAQWEMDQVFALNPGFSVAYLEEASAFRYQTDLESFLDGVRKAMGGPGGESALIGNVVTPSLR